MATSQQGYTAVEQKAEKLNRDNQIDQQPALYSHTALSLNPYHHALVSLGLSLISFALLIRRSRRFKNSKYGEVAEINK